jgi:hypothetical protein
MIDVEDMKSYGPATNGKTLTKFLQDFSGNVIKGSEAVIVGRFVSANIFCIYSDANA